jgi:hypothetical protein
MYSDASPASGCSQDPGRGSHGESDMVTQCHGESIAAGAGPGF